MPTMLKRTDKHNDLMEHYVTFHSVHLDNWFFENFFECKAAFLRPGKCLRCADLTTISQETKFTTF